MVEKQFIQNKNTFIAFLDLEKAFDNVQWKQLFEILKRIGIKYNDRRFIYNMYKSPNTYRWERTKCKNKKRSKTGVYLVADIVQLVY
jgi:hypothetical protein